MQLLRRYRLQLTLALPAGLVLGALSGLALFASSNEDSRTLGWLGYMATLGAGVGVVTAVVSALGASCAIVLDARRRADAQPSPALGLIAVGAGTAVALVVLASGLTLAVVQNEWSELEFWALASFTDAVIAVMAAVGICAATMRRAGTRA